MTTCGWTKGPWHWSDKFDTEDGRYTWTLLGESGYGILGCDGLGNSPQGLNDEANARLIAAAPQLYEALADLLSKVERDECHHESTHRGGAIWTFCNDCGKKWADDEGGFVPYGEPTHITIARAALAEARWEG